MHGEMKVSSRLVIEVVVWLLLSTVVYQAHALPDLDQESTKRLGDIEHLIGKAPYRDADSLAMDLLAEVEEANGNEASIRTNQRLGFRYICSQDFFFGFLFESLQNYLFAGYHHLVQLNDPESAAWWFRKSMKKSVADNQPISSGYRFHATRAFAELKEYESAIEWLQAALPGWQGPGEFRRRLESEPAFDCLRGSQEFEEILRKIEKMASE